MREPIFPSGGFFAPDDALGMLAFEEDRAMLRHVLRAARRTGVLEFADADADGPGGEGEGEPGDEPGETADVARPEPVAS
jgi:hypothetical protein